MPGGAEMSTGVAVKLAAFTGKESARNGLRTVSFTGLEPGEDLCPYRQSGCRFCGTGGLAVHYPVHRQ